ncbi:multisubstrate pseudouridine synthase 7 [Coemansia sp. RSA 2399]|nr:multisubstrate pseudouridine synthase 7 [Coemansia sp. RSA 2399]KAJ1908194.1 multisubstrate pseudouridine synthase 7 [Coemansia sp. IMI 209127]
MAGTPTQKSLESDDILEKRKYDDSSTDIGAEASKLAKRIKDDVDSQTNGKDTEDQYLREADVGITQFVTPGWGGFDAIIKHRFSDFFVNEIDEAGKVEHLTSYTEADDPEPPATEEEKVIEQLQVPDDLQEAFDQGIGRLEGILGDADAARIKAHLEITERQTLEERSFILDRELSKDERKQVYFVTNNYFPVQLTCETVEGKLKFIRKNASAEGDKEGRSSKKQARGRGRGPQWRHIGDYCHFVMQKENHDTMDVLSQIARQLHVSPRSLGVAGTKDKRGITVQRCSAYRIDHGRLIWASKKLRGARLGNYSYATNELKLGDLGGNQFRIVLRHVKGADAQSLAPVLEGIRTTGFVNYYGMQRFGTQSISSHTVGVAVLKADWQGAVDLILKPRPGDRKEVRDARDTWYQTNDATAALKLLPQRAALAEYSILQAFSKSGNASNAAGAFSAIPRNLRLMYVHAYQSYIWNSAVSERIRLYGIGKAVPGDLVIKTQGLSKTDNEETIDGSDGKVAGHAEPTLVTSDNAGEFTIYDVVLPLPGWAIKYPEHEARSVYLEKMEKDGLSALDKHPLKEYRLAGAYRHMVIKPREFSHEWMRYNDDKQPLARSDSDAIEGKHDPESIDFGEHVALKLSFDLPSSAYATMLLRELMRQETAAGHQTTLSSKTGYE